MMLALLLNALLLTVSGCASQSPSVLALPQPAKPQVPAELMQPVLSKPLSYQSRLTAAFATLPRMPTAK